MPATKKPDDEAKRFTVDECHQIAIALNLLSTLRAAVGTDFDEERAVRQSALAKLVARMNEHRNLVRDDAGNVVAKVTPEGGAS